MAAPTSVSGAHPSADPVPTALSRWRTMGELLDWLGGIPAARVRLHPAPGHATELDWQRASEEDNVPCELVEGVLVEKAMGFQAALLAGALVEFLRAFVRTGKLGLVLPGDGPLRFLPGVVRLPDVSFISWRRLPSGRVPAANVPDLVADLVVEVLSPGNTPGEMARKRTEYFTAGTPLVWIVDPVKRTVAVYTQPETFTLLNEQDMLDGGDVLPGFSLPLRDLFGELDQTVGEQSDARQ